MINRVVRVGAPAVVAGLLLSGCSGGASPGTAVVIGSERLTVAQVQERTAAFLEAYPATESGTTAAEVSRTAVQTFIQNIATDAVAAEQGIDVTEAEIDDFIEQLGGMEATMQAASQPGLLVPPDPVLVRQAVRQNLLLPSLAEALAPPGASDQQISEAVFGAIADKAEELDIEVNPRFGEWDGSAVQAGEGSLSTPLSELGDDAETAQG